MILTYRILSLDVGFRPAPVGTGSRPRLPPGYTWNYRRMHHLPVFERSGIQRFEATRTLPSLPLFAYPRGNGSTSAASGVGLGGRARNGRGDGKVVTFPRSIDVLEETPFIAVRACMTPRPATGKAGEVE